MKLTKKQRIALEFLAEFGPFYPESEKVIVVIRTLSNAGLVRYLSLWDWTITKKGREALKEAQK